MKLMCNISVNNRLLPGSGINPKRKHVKSTLALCKNPKSEEFCLILFNIQNKTGTKYELKGNVTKVLTKFLNEGKVTLQFQTPPHDLFVQAEVIQLKSFLHLLKRALEGKIGEKELTYSSMAVTAITNKEIAPKKLVITKRSEYPIKGFPRTLEVLQINDIGRCSLDRGILNLTKLKVLDLSNNNIERLPAEFNKLPNLCELNLSCNQFGRSTLKDWKWLGGNLAKKLTLLNLSNNNLACLPDQIVKLQNLLKLDVSSNQLKLLPSGIGNLRCLKVLNASNNMISILPGSAKKWRLHSLDLSNNQFNPNYRDIPAPQLPKLLPVCTLKEFAAKRTLEAKLMYSGDDIPYTLVEYLDHAKYCVCGKACFEVYFQRSRMLLLSSVTEILTNSSEGLGYVPIDCYFCSLRCFGSAISHRLRIGFT